MLSILAFGLTLLTAVLLSALARRSVLSTAVLFLAAGFLFGPGGLGFADGMEVEPEDFRADCLLRYRKHLDRTAAHPTLPRRRHRLRRRRP